MTPKSSIEIQIEQTGGGGSQTDKRIIFAIDCACTYATDTILNDSAPIQTCAPMSDQAVAQLPENTCAYERYDPKTLQPLNAETYVRLQELSWSAADFAGRSVLDIGCNSGLLTMFALRLGAAKVQACDVQPALLEFVSSVVQARKLPVTVSRIAFKDIDPVQMKSDVVLFMEVLHWAVSQGMELRDVIRRLAALTGELLYIEFPWSVEEPSIQKQTKLTAETYSADAVLDELTRYFKSVRVVRFMRYFGFKSGSKRVLIEARAKRPEADILAQLPGIYSLDVGLTRGRNESYLLAGARGPLVAKMLAREGTLFRIPEALCNRLFDELRHSETVLVPEKVNDSYLLSSPGGKRWMLLPYVGALPSGGKIRGVSIDFETLTNLFIQVRRDLRPVSMDVIAAMREQRLHYDLALVASAESGWAVNPGELAEIKDPLLEALALLPVGTSEAFDAVCHGDLQTGNFVRGNAGEIKVVDLDNLCVAPIYFDGLMALIWRGADLPILLGFCERLRAEEKRPVGRDDVVVSIANGVAWFSAVRSQNSDPLIQEQIARLRNGLSAALQLLRSLE